MAFRPVHEPCRITQDQYLARVRHDRQTRSVFLDGIVTPVPQDSAAHRRICTNLMQALTAQLPGSIPSCQVFIQPLLAVAPQRPSSPIGMFTYPDLALVVGPPDYRDASCTALWNPTVLLEVTSPETEAFDMDEKFLRYRRGLPSLQEYVLVAGDRCEVGHYRALAPDQWPLTSYTNMDDVLIFNRMPVRVALSAIYEGVLVHTTTDAELEPREEVWQWYER